MKTISTLHAPMRIMGIQAKCDLVDVHGTLANLWTRWVDDKAIIHVDGVLCLSIP